MLVYDYFWGAKKGKGTLLVRSRFKNSLVIVVCVWVTLISRPKLLTGFLIILVAGRCGDLRV